MEISGLRPYRTTHSNELESAADFQQSQFLQLTRQTRMLYHAGSSNRPKGEERIAQGFSPGNADATKLPSKGVQVRHEAGYYSAGESPALLNRERARSTE